MRFKGLLAGCAVVGLLWISASAAADNWLHVRVVDGDETVRVNVPLGVIERMLPVIQIDELQSGKLLLDNAGRFEGIDLRELAAALHDAPDADFVTIDSDDEKVRVAKEGDFLVVRVEDSGAGSTENVRVKLPLAVLDALVGGDPGSLDLVAALRALGDHADDALVDIRDGDETVRIWIDSSQSGEDVGR